MTGKANARGLRGAALIAATVAWCLCASLPAAFGQHGGQRPTPHPQAPRAQAPRPQPRPKAEPRQQNRPQPRPQPRPQNVPQGYPGQRPQNAPMYPGQRPAYAPNPVRPAYPNGYPNSAWGARSYPGGAPNTQHLGPWLNEHRSAPQDQEKLLRNDPSFNRLSPNDQQKVLRQLHNVDQMPEAERQRREARTEAIERLSPQERMQASMAARRWSTLPQDRQALMRRAFNDLRSVPPDQRSTVLGSARYQNMFSPEERGMLSDVLKAEPYTVPRP